MKTRIVGFIAGTAVALSLIVVPAFGTGGTADAKGCKEFGQATAEPLRGVPGGWGPESKAQNEAGPPGIIASNNEGAKAALCN